MCGKRCVCEKKMLVLLATCSLILPLALAGKGKAGEEILNRRTLFSKGYKERIGLNKTEKKAVASSSLLKASELLRQISQKKI